MFRGGSNCMSKLLRRAKVMLDHANGDYKKIGTDDAYLDSCCYSLQQCIEFTLKYLVEINGEAYVENHDVRAQLNKLDKLNVQVPFITEIRNMASTLNGWEAETRYKDDFLAVMSDVDSAFVYAKELIKFAETFAANAQMQRLSSFPNKRV